MRHIVIVNEPSVLGGNARANDILLGVDFAVKSMHTNRARVHDEDYHPTRLFIALLCHDQEYAALPRNKSHRYQGQRGRQTPLNVAKGELEANSENLWYEERPRWVGYHCINAAVTPQQRN
tara:strand:+ start:192 stop:554 length:363 start_codon:yes stop_codon:yes gene_type:complete